MRAGRRTNSKTRSGIEICDRQNIKKINTQKLGVFLEKLFNHLQIEPDKISFCLCDNALIKELNKRYLSRESVTDVIAFPLEDETDSLYLGEVVVSVEEAFRKGSRIRGGWEGELLLYLVHGVLHLIGYDDTTKKTKMVMFDKQKQLLKTLGKTVF